MQPGDLILVKNLRCGGSQIAELLTVEPDGRLRVRRWHKELGRWNEIERIQPQMVRGFANADRIPEALRRSVARGYRPVMPTFRVYGAEGAGLDRATGRPMKRKEEDP